VLEGPQGGVRDRQQARDPRGQHRAAAVAEEGLPHAVEHAQLEQGQVGGDGEPDQGHPGDGQALPHADGLALVVLVLRR
jgi:hypothetical protein